MLKSASNIGLAMLTLLAALGSPALAVVNHAGNATLTITAVAPREAGAEPCMIYLDGMFDAADAARRAGLFTQER